MWRRAHPPFARWRWATIEIAATPVDQVFQPLKLGSCDAHFRPEDEGQEVGGDVFAALGESSLDHELEFVYWFARWLTKLQEISFDL